VLILGESGTGKDVVALAIHRQSALRAGPFVKLNCDMASESLLESELFGREDDAQSDGASAEGRLESASGGSLFLQDVGDLPLRSQVRLMRLLEERVADGGKERPSGEIAPRLIAASSKDLTAAIAKGSFLEGLYYRLAVLVIRVPALRDRKEDIRQLAEGFLKRFAAQFDRPNLQFDSEALRALERHAWPGNLRELENCVRRAAIMSDTDILRADDLGLTPSTVQPAAAGLREARQSAERAVIIGALRKHHGKITAASMELGISRPTFYSLMEKLGIERRSLIWDHSEETSEE
ncbi:MAG TPA: sigma 54-interacting transcriptional regulator, partial [Candidatus Paceibacterota bacterium]|nr:sigma 54-interacting transcriptional regulator [Candidatus Paceibacterota bacterium]